MKSTCFLLLIVVAFGENSEENTTVKEIETTDEFNNKNNEFNSIANPKLPAPKIYGISTNFDDDGRTILWLPVETTEPVLGYKARVWEVGYLHKKKKTYKTINGKTVLVEENVLPRLRDFSTLHSLKEYVLKDHYLVLSEIERNVTFHVMVLAYNEAGDGPLSAPFRFKLFKNS